MHEIRIAIPSAIINEINKIGSAHNICQEYGKPMMRWIIAKTKSVGINLKRAITVAEIGNITRGKDVLRISL
jgi:hypothetical protein